jgi:hypothetical protein
VHARQHVVEELELGLERSSLSSDVKRPLEEHALVGLAAVGDDGDEALALTASCASARS